MKVKLNKKKTTIIIFLILTVVICGNAFAALTGAPNIFFAIKNMMVQNEIKGEEELLVDRDITISYYPIKIKDGVELQVNRIFIEETKSTLFISLNNKNNDDEQLGINIYDLLDNNNTKNILKEEKFLIQKGMKRNFEIELDKKVSVDEKLLLEIIIGGKSVDRNVIVDLASKEIIIEGKEEVKKISEVELKRYLGCFSVLNYENLKMNDRLIYVAERMNTEIFKDEIETNSQRELFMNIIDSFYNGVYTTEIVNEIEIIKANKQQYFYDESSDTYPGVTDGAQLPRGLCLGIEDISYKSGIYTVEFIYVLPTLTDLEENRVEELEQYKATIELELNENTEYSKYKVVNLGDATVVKEQEKIESNVSEAFATKESDCEKLLDRYLKIYFNLMQNALNLPVDLGLADKHDIKLYELVEFQGENDAFYNTGIDYSKYEEAMSKYMTKKCMDIHFSAYTNDINDTLYVLATGGSDIYYEVTEFELDSKNGDVYNYKGKIINYTADHADLTEYEKTPKNMEVEIKKVDDKFLISNVIIDYNDYTEEIEDNKENSIEDNEENSEITEPKNKEETEQNEVEGIGLDGITLINFVKEHGTVYYGVSKDKAYEIELMIFDGIAYYNVIETEKSSRCIAGKFSKENGELVLVPYKYCDDNQEKFEINEMIPSHVFTELSDGSYRLVDDDSNFGAIVLSEDKSMATRKLEESFDHFDNWDQISGKYIFEKVEKNGERVEFSTVFGDDVQNEVGYVELSPNGGLQLQLLNQSEVEYGTFVIDKNNTISMLTDSISGTQEYDTITRTLKLNYNDYTIYARYQ